MIHRFLERSEGTIREMVPLAYLLSLMAGTTAVFSGIAMSTRQPVGIALGVVIELHTFLVVRIVRVDYTAWRTERTASASARLWASIIPLACMLGVQSFCSYVYTAESYHPLYNVVPRQLLVVGIAVVVPAFAFLAGFLIEVTQSPADLLRSSNRAMLQRTMRGTVKTWSKRLREAERSGANLAGVARALLEDVGATEDARRLGIMDNAIPGGKPAPRTPTPPKGRKRTRSAPRRSRSELDEVRQKRKELLHQELDRTGKLTLNRAQQLTGMRNRQGVQMLVSEVKQERAG